MALDPAFEALDRRFYRYLIHNSHIDHLWQGARWTEGPVYVPAARQLVFSDIPNDRTLRYDELTGDTTVFEQPALNQNGHCLDRQGRVVIGGATVAAGYRTRGEAMPGFNHYLFVHGDPRAAALVELAGSLGSQVPSWLAASQGAGPLLPTLDFGVVALRRALGAPRHAALTITHMARAAGTLAQALEQRQHGRRMWVQSRYVGPLPGPAPGR